MLGKGTESMEIAWKAIRSFSELLHTNGAGNGHGKVTERLRKAWKGHGKHGKDTESTERTRKARKARKEYGMLGKGTESMEIAWKAIRSFSELFHTNGAGKGHRKVTERSWKDHGKHGKDTENTESPRKASKLHGKQSEASPNSSAPMEPLS